MPEYLVLTLITLTWGTIIAIVVMAVAAIFAWSAKREVK